MNATPPSGLRAWRPVAAWLDFWFAPVDPVGLHRLRVLAGLVFLLWLLPLAGHADAFFGLGGWFDRRAFGEAGGLAARYGEEAPVPLWSVLYWCESPSAVRAVYWASVGVLALFTLGVWPRLTAVLTYVVVASFTAAPAAPYDVDPLLILLAFYLALGYVLVGQLGREVSWSERLFGPKGAFLLSRARPSESAGANVAVRLFQVHFAVAMVASGLHKLQFPDWWYGVAYWYSLHAPFSSGVQELRALRPGADSYLVGLSLAAYATLAWQIGFPAFAWRRGLGRGVLLAGAVAGFVGCAFVLNWPLFGPVIAVGCLSYLTPSEWCLPDRIAGGLLGRGRTGEASAVRGPKAPASTAITGGHRR